MLPGWPSLTLVLVLIVYWLVFRLYAWRTTLPAGAYVMFFTFGAIGSGLIALYLQAVPFPFPLEDGTNYARVDPKTWFIGPPIEEVAKALPVLLIALLLPVARKLTIADFALIGFSTGLGFAFLESNVQQVLAHTVSSFGNVFGLGMSVDGRGSFDNTWAFAGHAAYPAFVGVAAGIGLRFFPRSWHAAPILALAALALASFDHGMVNFKEQHAYPNSFGQAAVFVEFLSRHVSEHGFAIILSLPPLVVAASWLEGLLAWRAVADPDETLLPAERGPRALSELLIVAVRLPLGYGAVTRTLRYFAHRRGLTIAALEAAGSPGDPTAIEYAAWSRARLLGERAWVAQPVATPWLPSRKEALTVAQSIARRYAFVIFALVLVFLVFMVSPQIAAWLHTQAFAIVVVLLAAALVIRRVALFVRTPRPEPASEDGESVTAYDARAMLLGASGTATSLSLLAVTLGRHAIVPVAAAYVSQYVDGWVSGGGNIEVLLGTAGIAGAAEPPPEEPCADLRRDAEAGAARLKSMEAELEALIQRLSGGAASPGDPPSGDDPLPPGARPVQEPANPEPPPRYYADAPAAPVARAGFAGAPSSDLIDPNLWNAVQQMMQKRALPQVPDAVKLPGQPDDEISDADYDQLQRRAEAIQAEEDAQEQRQAALAACEAQAAATPAVVPPPVTGADPAALAKLLADRKAEFDKLQDDLAAAMKKDLDALADFDKKYNDLWARAMQDLKSYMLQRQALAPELADLWKARSTAATVQQYAGMLDKAVMAAQLGGAAMSKLLAGEGAAFAKAMGAEGAEVGASAARLDGAAVTAEREAAAATGAVGGDAAAAAKTAALEAQGEEAAAKLIRWDSPVLPETGVRPLSELPLPTDINSVGGKKNCAYCTRSMNEALNGRPSVSVPDIGPANSVMSDFENYYGAKWSPDTTSFSAVEADLLARGDGATSAVFVENANGKTHVFNAVNRNGVVVGVDAQTGVYGQVGEVATKGGYPVGSTVAYLPTK